MAITITTKYMPATNSRGSRIKAAIGFGRSVSIPYPHHLSGREAHDAAVRACLEANGLDVVPHTFTIGDTSGGYVYVSSKDTVTFGAK